MKNGSRYVFGAAVAGAALGLPGVVERAEAAPTSPNPVTAAAFTFESIIVPTITATGTAGTTTGGTTSASFGPYMADSGIGSAYGVHVGTATVYSSPSGNGSLHSLSANNFAVNDYFQFSVPTTNLMDLQFSFDQTSSGTGPKAFQLQYSVDGNSFIQLSSYTFATVSFNTSTSNANAAHVFDLTSVTALNNDAAAVFRIVDVDSTATNTGGTDRVDNVVLAGDPAVAAPEPSALMLASVAASGLLVRRRRNRACSSFVI